MAPLQEAAPYLATALNSENQIKNSTWIAIGIESVTESRRFMS